MVGEDVIAAVDIVLVDVDREVKMAGEDVVAAADIIVVVDIGAKGAGPVSVLAALNIITTDEIATVLPEVGGSESKFDLQYDQIISAGFHADNQNKAESKISRT